MKYKNRFTNYNHTLDEIGGSQEQWRVMDLYLIWL